MQLACPRCRRVLEYAHEAPSFCSYCGSSLTPTKTELPASEAATLPPAESGTAGPGGVPEQVGGYRLLRPLGAGGMGSVYEAEDAATGRRVALKLVLPGGNASADSLERFRQEGRLASAIAHPRCVFVLAADEEAGRPYIVMELMPGRTLEDLVKERGPLPPEEAVAAILDVLDGLKEAHRLGVIHRDVKPSNCFLEADGRVKVGDFGLAKSLARDVHLTKTGSFLGTLLYASPEQVRGDKLNEQTDQYSAAATLYFLLTGRAPHQSGDAVATMAAIVADPVPPLRKFRPELPASLERVVLRALDRDRQRRFRDLEEFRRALLPFVPGRLSIGGLGIRVGAYVIDYVLLSLVVTPFWVLSLARDPDRMFNPREALDTLPFQLLGLGVWVVYWGLLEGLWGWSPGKWLLGLRVRTMSGDSPGLARSFGRSALFQLAFGLGFLGAMVYWWVYLRRPLTEPEVTIYANVINAINLAGLVVGLALLFSPMRARNGYRGLHEFATGTRVVRLPARPRRRAFPSDPPEAHVVPAEGPPGRLGPFVVQGSLPAAGAGTVLLGSDPVLGRAVWLWVRPSGEPALAEARRQLGRATRPRWLASGRLADSQWDAFLAPAGCTLPDVIAGEGALPWRDARPLLEQLADELTAACADDTLPAAVGVGQVWVQPGGELLLLDFPLQAAPAGAPAPHAEETAPARALGLLRQVAALALEGRPRPADAPGSAPRARAPLHARGLLDRLAGVGPPYPDVRRFQEALHGTREQPVEVTRLRRAAQLGLWATLALCGPCSCLLGGPLVPLFSSIALYADAMEGKERLRDLEVTAGAECAAAMLNPQPLSRLRAAVQLREDLALRDRLEAAVRVAEQRRQVRLRPAGPPGRFLLSIAEQSFRVQFPAERQRLIEQRVVGPANARQAAHLATILPDNDPRPVFWGAVVLTAFWPAVWVVWAFLWPGGLSYRLTGMAVVGADGRPAPRWRAALRQALVWLPVTGLLVLSLWADTRSWNEPDVAWLPWLAFAAWWAAALLLAGYAALALWQPARSLNDRLAGTYLVPL